MFSLIELKILSHLFLQLSSFLQDFKISSELIRWLQLHFLSRYLLKSQPILSFIVVIDSSSVIFDFILYLFFLPPLSNPQISNSFSLFTFPLILRSAFSHWYSPIFNNSSPFGLFSYNASQAYHSWGITIDLHSVSLLFRSIRDSFRRCIRLFSASTFCLI